MTTVTVLSPARTVFSVGLATRKRCKYAVATNPISNGGDEGGIIRSVYSTPIKNSNETAKKHGTGWYLNKPNTSDVVHCKNEASAIEPHLVVELLVFLRLKLLMETLFDVLRRVVVCGMERWWILSAFIVIVREGGC
ncbi:hypothetical protein Hanom_Chr11g00997571 [Helianthus anomalus]